MSIIKKHRMNTEIVLTQQLTNLHNTQNYQAICSYCSGNSFDRIIYLAYCKLKMTIIQPFVLSDQKLELCRKVIFYQRLGIVFVELLMKTFFEYEIIFVLIYMVIKRFSPWSIN